MCNCKLGQRFSNTIHYFSSSSSYFTNVCCFFSSSFKYFCWFLIQTTKKQFITQISVIFLHFFFFYYSESLPQTLLLFIYSFHRKSFSRLFCFIFFFSFINKFFPLFLCNKWRRLRTNNTSIPHKSPRSFALEIKNFVEKIYKQKHDTHTFNTRGFGFV